jgi:hypothetical protein
MNNILLLLGVWVAAWSASAVQAAEAGGCSMRSPPHRVALLELYTSEGCSSCPPADAFLSGTRAALRPDQAVPLSMHVDYWNYIGWKDPYSRKTFTERQQWLTELAGSRTVYTPEFFVAGKELRGWRDGTQAAVARINQQPAQADISIAIGPAGAGGLPLVVTASAKMAGKLYVALVESGIARQVRAGENQGRLLRHDYVVREWLAPVTLAPAARAAGGVAQLSRTVALPAGASPGKLAVSAFVQSEQGEVLQAATLSACGT